MVRKVLPLGRPRLEDKIFAVLSLQEVEAILRRTGSLDAVMAELVRFHIRTTKRTLKATLARFLRLPDVNRQVPRDKEQWAAFLAHPVPKGYAPRETVRAWADDAITAYVLAAATKTSGLGCSGWVRDNDTDDFEFVVLGVWTIFNCSGGFKVVHKDGWQRWVRGTSGIRMLKAILHNPNRDPHQVA